MKDFMLTDKKNLFLIALFAGSMQAAEFTLYNATALSIYYSRGGQVAEIAPGHQLPITAQNGDFLEIGHHHAAREVFIISINRGLLHAVCEQPYGNNSFKIPAFVDNKLCVSEDGFCLEPKLAERLTTELGR